MNLLYICNEYPPGKSGGIGSATKNLATAMAGLGHKVFVAGLYMPGYGRKDYEETDGVKVWRKRIGMDIGPAKDGDSFAGKIAYSLLKRTGLLSLSYQKGSADFFAFIQSLIHDNAIDLVEWPDFNEWFSLVHDVSAIPVIPVPLLVKLHGNNSYTQHQTGRPFNEKEYATEKAHILGADALVAVSKHTAIQYALFYGLAKEIPVLYNPILCNLQEPNRAAMRSGIVFAGSLTQFKGVYNLLLAWNHVHQNYPDCQLRLYGKGRPEKFRHLLTNEAAKTVHFMGHVTQRELQTVFSSAAAAVFPSFSECFSMTPMETMSCGCPVIYTERSSGPELIENGINGLLVNPGDPAAIADAIVRLLSDEVLRETLGNKGRETVNQRFSIQKSAADHLLLYQKLVDQYHRNKTALCAG
ncbi:MAG: glycosyltransferase family 4 protein [Bacteroidota bacterium]